VDAKLAEVRTLLKAEGNMQGVRLFFFLDVV